jgi:hypothetical protein
MGVCTRPSKTHRQQRNFQICALAVILSVSPASAAPTVDFDDVKSTESIAQDTAHEVSITVVEPGQERIALTARLTTLSTTAARDVTWQVRNETGELVLNQITHELESPLAPGEYTVEAQYGAVSVRETVRLTEGNAIAVNFVLNAGGLRVLPALKDIVAPDIPTKTLVYALAGPDKGKLIAHSAQAGELIKLVAGQYRVETRIGNGNTSAVTDVRVRPGKLSAIEMSHKAGIARLNYVGSPDAQVKWDVRPIDGSKIISVDGLTQKLALKPGTYLAEAHVNGEILTAKFKIVAGEERDIMLGN